MDLVNNIVDIMVSVITSHKRTIRIGREEIPQTAEKEGQTLQNRQKRYDCYGRIARRKIFSKRL